MSQVFDVIAFDADDTLWHNESLYAAAQDRFKLLLSNYLDAAQIDARLYETEMRNLQHYGYGIKAFALSMIESAIELTEARISAEEIRQIIGLAREMLDADVQLLDHTKEIVAQLSESHTLMLITKGDLLDQERKLARSGIAPYFRHIEIISDKTRETYQAILTKYGIDPARFLMVGNSLRSDILPVLELGGHAVYIPYHTTWAHEIVAETESQRNSYLQLEHIGRLPALIEGFGKSKSAAS